ncbi:MAG TPA: hypothetical protein ENJ11_02120 [Gammaproteobacteria bacterium]|nr:hypothetical protein [Gammaproteobacteria bacterium]
MIPLQKKPANHLTEAYNHIMAAMAIAFEEAEPGELTLQVALKSALKAAIDRGELSYEEASEIIETIKRDINDAAEFMMESSSEFHDWLSLDIEVIEYRVMRLFLNVAKNTRVALQALGQA